MVTKNYLHSSNLENYTRVLNIQKPSLQLLLRYRLSQKLVLLGNGPIFPTMCINLFNTLPHMRYCLARGEATFIDRAKKNMEGKKQNTNEEQMQTE